MNHVNSVAIVGGGLAGLTAATLLARAGLPVIVFEKSRSPGGRARSEKYGDFILNLGPHALYCGGQAKATWRRMGIDWQAGKVPSSGGKVLLDGTLHELPYSTLTLLRTRLFPAAKLEAARLLGSLPRLRPEALGEQTVSEWLEQAVRNANVRRFIAALIRLSTYADAPSTQRASAAIAQLQLAIRDSVEYVDGGWQTLVDRLANAALAAGAEIRTGAVVTRVDETRRVFVDGETIGAGAVLIATPPEEAATLLEGAAAGEWLRRECARMNPVRAASLDLCLSRLPEARSRFVLGVDRPLYFSVHSTFARLAPPGAALVHAGYYLGSCTSPDVSAIERELESLVDLAQPGWRSHVVHRRFLPSLVVSYRLAAGNPIPCEVPGAPGLYLAGEWVGEQGMLADAAVASARRAAETMQRAMHARVPAA